MMHPGIPFGEELPAPKVFEELIELLLDGSGSMTGEEADTGRSKAEQVIHHLISSQDGLLQRLRTGKNRDAYYLAVVTFDDRVDVSWPLKVTQISDRDLNIQLTQKHGQSTAIGLALREARLVAEQWLVAADPLVPRIATILLLSDGVETAGSDPLAEAAATKVAGATRSPLGRPSVMIATAAYGGDADETTLRVLASDGPDGAPLFKRVNTGQELRDFFLRSVTATTPGGQV